MRNDKDKVNVLFYHLYGYIAVCVFTAVGMGIVTSKLIFEKILIDNVPLIFMSFIAHKFQKRFLLIPLILLSLFPLFYSIPHFLVKGLPLFIISISIYLNENSNFSGFTGIARFLIGILIAFICMAIFLLGSIIVIYLMYTQWLVIRESFIQMFNPLILFSILLSTLKSPISYIYIYITNFTTAISSMRTFLYFQRKFSIH